MSTTDKIQLRLSGEEIGDLIALIRIKQDEVGLKLRRFDLSVIETVALETLANSLAGSRSEMERALGRHG